MAQNITGAGTQMADYLTSVWNGFQATAENAIDYVDKMAAVADSSASDMSELAIAMSKVASTANAMGVDIDQLNAQIATIVATTRQAPESVGTALKTIYARINDIVTGADAAEVSLGNYSGQMAALGFNVFDANGKLRDTGEVIEEVGGRWENLSRQQQIYLARTMAGTRQYNNLIALFDNWTQYSEMLNVSLNAQGTIHEKNARYMESVKAHMEQLNAETERTYMILSDTKALNAVTDLARQALTIFNDLIQGMGGGINVLVNFSSQFVNLFSNQIGKAINTQVENVKSFIANLDAVKMKQDVINAVRTNADAQGRSLSTQALEKQATYAERILNIRKSLTQQEYNDFTKQQEKIGALQTQYDLLKQQAQIYATKLGMTKNDSTGQYQNVLAAEKNKLQIFKDQLLVLKEQAQGWENIPRSLNARKDLEKEIQEIIKEQNAAGRNTVQLQNLLNELKSKSKYNQEIIQKILDYQNGKIKTQVDLINQINKALKNKQDLEDTENQTKAQERITDAMLKQRQHQQAISNAIRATSAVVQGLTAAVGGMNTILDETASGAQKANGAFAAISGSVAGLANAFAPGSGFLVQGIFSLGKGILELTGLWDNVINYFSTSEERMQAINIKQKQINQSTKQYKNAREEVEGLKEEFESLQMKSNHFSEEQQKRFNQIAQIFNKYNQGVIVGYDAQGDAIVRKNNVINETLDKLDQQYQKVLRNKAETIDLSTYDAAYNDLQGNIQDLQLEIKTLSYDGLQDLGKAIVQIEKAGHTKIGPLMEQAYMDMYTALQNITDSNQLPEIINKFYDTMMEGNEQNPSLISRLAQLEDESDKDFNDLKELLQQEVNSVSTLFSDTLLKLNAAIKDKEEGIIVPTDIILTKLKATDEYSKLKQQLGAQWFTFGEDMANLTLINFIEGHNKVDSNTQANDLIILGRKKLEKMAQIIDPAALSEAIQKKNNELQQQTQLSLEKTNQIIYNAAMDFYKNVDVNSFNEQDRNLFYQLLKAAFGLDISSGRFQSEIEQQVNEATNIARGAINQLLDNPSEMMGLKQSQEFKDWLMTLTEDQFYAVKAELQNLDYVGITTFDDLIEKLQEIAKEAENAETALSWQDQLKVLDALTKGQGLEKIQGGYEYLQGMILNNTGLAEAAAAQGGLYGQAFVEAYKNVIKTGTQERLNQAQSNFDELAEKARELSEEDQNYEQTMIDLAQAAFQLALAQSNLKDITQDTNEQIKTQLQLLQQAYQKGKSVYQGGTSAYDTLSSGESLSQDQAGALSTLEAQNPELQSYSSNRYSEQYLQALRKAIELYKEKIQLARQDQLAEVEAQIATMENIQRTTEQQEQYQELLARRIQLQTQGMQQAKQHYNSLQEMISAFQEFSDALQQEDGLTAEEGQSFKEYLNQLEDKYPQLIDAAQMLKNTWLAGTDEYQDALEQVQETLEGLQIAQAFEGLQEDIDSIEDVEINVDVYDQNFQNWVNYVEDFFAKDRQISIAIDNAVNREFEQMQAHLDQIYEAAGKIGQNFIVAAQDIGQVMQVFPQITQGMQMLDDGSYQLSQNMVQYALGAAEEDINASTQATIEKLQLQADYHTHKAEIYDQIANLAGQLASGQVAVGKSKADTIADLQTKLGELQQQTKESVAQFAITKDQAVATNTANMAQAGATDVDKMAASMSQSYINWAQVALQAIANVADGMAQVNNGQPVSVKEFPGYASPDTNVGSSFQRDDSLLGNQDIFDPSNVKSYTVEEFERLKAQAEARAQQERAAARAALAGIYELQGRLGKTLGGLGNVQRGQGINGAKPTNEKAPSSKTPSSKTPSSGKTPSSKTPSEKQQKATKQEEQLIEQVKNKKEKKLKDQVSLYHDINIQLDKIEKKLAKIQNREDKLTGKKLFNNLNKQLDILNKQINTLKEKIKLEEVEALNLKLYLKDYGVIFDKDGQIQNYRSVLIEQERAINEYISYYNRLTKEQQQYAKVILDQMKQNYEEFKKKIERYEEVVNKEIPELQQSIDEAIQKQVQIKIKKFKIGVQARIDLSQLKRDYNNFVRTVKKQLRSDDILGNGKAAFEDLKTYFGKKEYNPLIGQTDHIYDIIDQIDQINKTGTSSIYGDNKAGALEDLESAKDNLENDLFSIMDLMQQIRQKFLDSIDQIQEGFDKRQKYFQHISDILDHDAKVIQLIFGQHAYEKMNNLYTQQAQFDKQHLRDLSKQKDYWWALLEDARQRQSVLQAGSTDWQNVQDEIKKYEQYWLQASQNLNQTLENAIQNIISKYENAINQIFYDLNKKITGGFDLDYIGQEWELIQKQADQYLDAVNSMYEIQKLRTKYQDAIEANKDNIKAQKQLTALKQQQLNYLQNMDKISQYDIKRANKQLEIEQQRLAIQDQRANKTKSKLQLRRDSQGNYSYRFTAEADSDDQTNNKIQTLRDLRNQLYNMTKQQNTKSITDFYNMYSEYIAKASQAMIRYRNDQERMHQELELLNEHYSTLLIDKAQYVNQRQLQLAQETFAAITDTDEYSYRNVFDTDGKISTYYAHNYQDVQDWMNQNNAFINAKLDELAGSDGPYARNAQAFRQMIYNDSNGMVPTWQSGIITMIEQINGEGGFQEVINELMSQLDTATKNYKADLSELQAVSGVTFESIGVGVDNDIEKTNNLKTANDSLLETYKNIYNLMKKEWLDTLQAYISKHKELQAAIDAVTAAYQRMQREKEKDIRAANEDKQSGGTGSGTSGSSTSYGETRRYTRWMDAKGQHGTVGYTTNNKTEKITSIRLDDNEQNWEDFRKGMFDNLINSTPLPVYIGNTLVSQADKTRKDLMVGAEEGFAKTGAAQGLKYRTSYDAYAAWKKEAQEKRARKGTKENKMNQQQWKQYLKNERKKINQQYYMPVGYATGGYTGEWKNDSGRLAILHQKQLVLNSQDTQNILSAVNVVRDLAGLINSINVPSPAFDRGSASSGITQTVHITADFPSVTSSREIELALQSLTSRASQYIYRNR